MIDGLLRAVGLRRETSRRSIVLLPDPRFPLTDSAWECRLTDAGFEVIVHDVTRSLLDVSPVEVGDEALTMIDELVPSPVVIGFGRTAGAVLYIGAEGASVAAAVVGGLPDDDEHVDRSSPVRGPLLLVGGDADPDLPLEAFRTRRERQRNPSITEAVELRGSLRHLVSGEGADAAIGVVLAFLARTVPR